MRKLTKVYQIVFLCVPSLLLQPHITQIIGDLFPLLLLLNSHYLVNMEKEEEIIRDSLSELITLFFIRISADPSPMLNIF